MGQLGMITQYCCNMLHCFTIHKANQTGILGKKNSFCSLPLYFVFNIEDAELIFFITKFSSCYSRVWF